MTDPVLPPIHNWVPPTFTADEAAALKARWNSLDLDAALRTPPFQLTPEGRIDFRYMPLNDGSKNRRWQSPSFRSCDFTGALLGWITSEHGTFENCIFDRVFLQQFSDKGNKFTSCSFTNADWRAGSIGTDWNNSKSGEYESVYSNCLFREVNFAKTIFQDAVFIKCKFAFRRLKSVNFRSSGFWGCTFDGVFEDLSFQGEYHNDDARARKGRPLKVGFHNTSFANAKLRWIDARDNFPMVHVNMPEDGHAFLSNPRQMTARLQDMLLELPDELTRQLLENYMKVTSSSKNELRRITSRYDLFSPKEPQNEPAATWLYNYLKANFKAA